MDNQTTSKEKTINNVIGMFRNLPVFEDQIPAIKETLEEILDDNELDVILPLMSAYNRTPVQATQICRALRRMI